MYVTVAKVSSAITFPPLLAAKRPREPSASNGSGAGLKHLPFRFAKGKTGYISSSMKERAISGGTFGSR